MNMSIILQCSLFSHFDDKKYKPEVVFDLARECRRNGASIIHVHIDKFETYNEFIMFVKILDQIDAPMLSLGAKDVLSIKQSDLNNIRSWGCAAVQGGDATIFGNIIVQPYKKLYKEVSMLRSYDIIPEVSIFNFEAANNCNRLQIDIGHAFYVGVYMGYPGGIEATKNNVNKIMHKLSSIPVIFFTVFNNQDDDLLRYIIRVGGHIRSGLEDTIYCGKNVAENTEDVISYIGKIVREEGKKWKCLNKNQLKKYISDGGGRL